MPSGPRIRDNNLFGVTTDNPLTSGATTFNSLGLSKMSVVASAHALVTLDPIRQYGEPEVVVVTVHTASATVATITRAQYGTVARSHPVGTLWVSQPIDEDFIEVLTAATRPTNPYEGQFIFETDTNKLVGYGGVDWAPRDAGGQLANGYAQVVANQGAITAEVDLTGLTTTVTVGAGRRVKVTGEMQVQNNTVDVGSVVRIYQDGVQVQNRIINGLLANYDSSLHISVVLSPSSGVHTYKLRALTIAGTMTMTAGANYPAFILVEDIGAA